MRDLVADEYVARYGGTHEDAVAWGVVADRAGGLGEAVAASASGVGYAGVWFDQANKTINVGVTSGTPTGPVPALFANLNIAGNAQIVAADYTQAELEDAQPGIQDDLRDLMDAGVVEISRRAKANAIEIFVATSATSAQRAEIAAVARCTGARHGRGRERVELHAHPDRRSLPLLQPGRTRRGASQRRVRGPLMRRALAWWDAFPSRSRQDPRLAGSCLQPIPGPPLAQGRQ